jgi:hypothetical protein
MILDFLKSTADGSIVLDLSKVPDQWVFTYPTLTRPRSVPPLVIADRQRSTIQNDIIIEVAL